MNEDSRAAVDLDDEMQRLLKQLPEAAASPTDSPPPPPPVEEPPGPIVDLRQQFAQLDLVTDEVLQSARADRQENQDIINLLRGEIGKDVAQGRVANRGYVDNLVKALEVKSNINMTVVKILEARAKLIAATKVAPNISQTTNVLQTGAPGADATLVEILAKPLDAAADEY